jgi:tetratricopeptide (TPR) repeat protein
VNSTRNLPRWATSAIMALASLLAPGIAARGQSKAASSTTNGAAAVGDPAAIFQHGQEALAKENLDGAERDFRHVLALDPNSGAAYANLGVVHMRRKQWALALGDLEKASKLLPNVAGIRLNIGLVYYRQNEFLKAIPPFESVLRDQPDAVQPRYLLGLCYFFAERWKESADTLQPLWAQELDKLPYLYVLSNAAHRAGEKELDDRATARLIQIGDGSPQYRLFIGKYHLNLEQYDLALQEFQAAAAADPKLPFVHFNLGLTYLKKQDYDHARAEFLQDAAVEPDLALDYEELGDVHALQQDDAAAEKSYRQALRLNDGMVNSHIGLAKLLDRGGKYEPALAQITRAGTLDPDRTDIHYLRGQILLHLGRKQEGRQELEAAVRIDNERRTKRIKQLENGTVPSPELLNDPQ